MHVHKKHQCMMCDFRTHKKYNLNEHNRRKHGIEKASTSFGQYGGRAPTTVSVGQDGGRAPTTVSVGQDGGRAPTTISVAPQQPTSISAPQRNSLYKCRYCNFYHAYSWVVDEHMYVKHQEYFPSAFKSKPNPFTRQSKSGAPTTMSVPPVRGVQHGQGINMEDEDFNQEDEDMEDEESDASEDAMHIPACNIWDETRGEEERDFWEIADDLRNILNYIKDLRQEYRKALPQLKELEGKELKVALKTYAWLETTVHDEHVGLEDNAEDEFKHIDDEDTEEETEDEETEDEDDMEEGNDADTESDADTEVEDETDAEVETEDESEAEDETDAEIEKDVEVETENEEEDDSKKEKFWDFVYEARQFIDKEDLLEKFIKKAKWGVRYLNEIEVDPVSKRKLTTQKMAKDIEKIDDEFHTHGAECFQHCSRGKIASLSGALAGMMQPESVESLKRHEPRKLEFVKKMIFPYLKSVRKVADPSVSIHERRKTLQKAQVGEGVLNSVKKLILPDLKRAKYN